MDLAISPLFLVADGCSDAGLATLSGSVLGGRSEVEQLTRTAASKANTGHDRCQLGTQQRMAIRPQDQNRRSMAITSSYRRNAIRLAADHRHRRTTRYATRIPSVAMEIKHTWRRQRAWTITPAIRMIVTLGSPHEIMGNTYPHREKGHQGWTGQFPSPCPLATTISQGNRTAWARHPNRAAWRQPLPKRPRSNPSGVAISAPAHREFR